MSYTMLVVGAVAFALGCIFTGCEWHIRSKRLRLANNRRYAELLRELERKDADLDACHDNRRNNEDELAAKVTAMRQVKDSIVNRVEARPVPVTRTYRPDPTVEQDEPTETKSARKRRRRREREAAAADDSPTYRIA